MSLAVKSHVGGVFTYRCGRLQWGDGTEWISYELSRRGLGNFRDMLGWGGGGGFRLSQKLEPLATCRITYCKIQKVNALKSSLIK